MLDQIDLKALQAFDVLMEEKSQTKAANKLGKDQSTISYYLSKLRDLTGDVLFQRVGNELRPTSRALELHKMVKSVFELITEEFSSEDYFQYAKDEHHFKILANEYFIHSIAPVVLDELLALGGNIKLSIDLLPNLGSERLSRRFFKEVELCLSDREYDLVISDQTMQLDFDLLKQQKVFQDRYVQIYNRENQEILAALSNDMGVAKKARLAFSRNQEHSNLASFSGLYQASKNTLFESLVPERLAMDEYSDGLIEKEILEGGYPFELFQVWHVNFDKDLAHQWLRRFILKQCRALHVPTEDLESE